MIARKDETQSAESMIFNRHARNGPCTTQCLASMRFGREVLRAVSQNRAGFSLELLRATIPQ